MALQGLARRLRPGRWAGVRCARLRPAVAERAGGLQRSFFGRLGLVSRTKLLKASRLFMHLRCR